MRTQQLRHSNGDDASSLMVCTKRSPPHGPHVLLWYTLLQGLVASNVFLQQTDDGFGSSTCRAVSPLHCLGSCLHCLHTSAARLVWHKGLRDLGR